MSACPKCPHCTEIRKAKSKAAVLAKPPSRRSEKQQARKEHRASTKEIRAAVMARAIGWCELHYDGRGALATDMHHLDGGSRRRKHQSVANCVMICARCHREYHTDPEAFRARVEAHCAGYGYPLPSRFRRPHVEKSPGA